MDGIDDFGMYRSFNVSDFTNNSKISFLVHPTSSWAGQTVDIDLDLLNYKSTKVDNSYVMNLYVTAITLSNISIVDNVEDAFGPYIAKAKYNLSSNSITFTGSEDSFITSYSLYALTGEYFVDYKVENLPKYILKTENLSDVNSYEISLPSSHTVGYQTLYYLTCTFKGRENSLPSEIYVDMQEKFNETRYINQVYNGDDLGVTFDEFGVPIFKVFAPNAALVKVNLYRRAYDSSYIYNPTTIDEYWGSRVEFEIIMNAEGKGIFTSLGDCGKEWNDAAKEKVAKGEYYYTYTAYTSKGANEVVDPYAKSVGLHSLRGMVIDLDDEELLPESYKSVPSVWDKAEGYDISSPQELVISENHIRDLTMDETWTSDEDLRSIAGTYKAFATKGTTYKSGNVEVKTGFDHLEEYGVNAVQLLPIYDQDNLDNYYDPSHDYNNGDKVVIPSKFNWGYNPLNYNAPEGSYATSAYDGKTRVYELREMIGNLANNKNHTRVIMDVVYNHVSSASKSNFELLAPGYYFRYDENGNYLDNTGCSNEFKSEAKMARKFIVDSVTHWAEDYKIKGFRFDLMAVLDIETMRQVKNALYNVDPDIVIYGEGWDATGTYSSNSEHANTSAVYSYLAPSDVNPSFVGAFNDAGRNGIRGGNNGGNGYPGYGFISQGSSDLQYDTAKQVSDLFKGINSWAGDNPIQTVNYASCHDNYTLFDQLYHTLSNDGGITPPSEETVAKASVATNGFIIMSNGISFVNGGEEIFRTKIEEEEDEYTVNMYGKYITHNSYKSSDKTNSYKYDRKVKFLKYFNMYKDLVEIKKNLIPFNSTDSKNRELIDTWGYGANATTIAAYRRGKDSTNYYFLLNGRSDSARFDIDTAYTYESIFNNDATFAFSKDGYSVNSNYSYGIFKLGGNL